jgi:hypothetical protein
MPFDDDDRDRAESMLDAAMSAARVYDARQITNARRMWRDLRRTLDAPEAAPGTWAAAVEYAIVRIDFVEGISQAAIARRYGVSARQVASSFARIQDTLDLLPFDTRYATETVEDEPGDGLPDAFPGDDGDEVPGDGVAVGAPFAAVRGTREFEEDVRGLVRTGRPFAWIVSVVAKAHPPEGIHEYQRLVEAVQDVWNSTPRDEFNGRTPEEMDKAGGRE